MKITKKDGIIKKIRLNKEELYNLKNPSSETIEKRKIFLNEINTDRKSSFKS